MNKKEITIKKPSAMIQTSVKGLTLTQRKFINTLVHVAQKEGNQNTYKISLVTLKKVCNIKTESNYELKAQVRKLHEKSIEYNILGKDKKNTWISTPILGGVNIKDGTGIMEFEIPYFIKEQILNPEIYAPLDIILIAGFSCVYTIVLYEFLRDYLNSPKVPLFTVMDFRNLVGVDEHKYKLFKDFRKYVINRAIDEINEKSDLLCSYDLIKEIGNKYSHIQFHVKRYNNSNQMELILDIPENVINSLPEKHHTDSVYNLIREYCREPIDTDYIISNIKYSLLNSKKNFSFYLKKSLNEDYAKSEREENQRIQILKHKKEMEELQKIRKEEEATNKGETLYNFLTQDELTKYSDNIRIDLKNNEIPASYINDALIKSKIIELLLKEDEGKRSGIQESLF